MSKVLNRPLHIHTNGEDALKVNGSTVIDKDGAVHADIHAAAGSIGTSELANLAVTADKLAAGSVVTTKIANGAVTSEKLAAGAGLAALFASGNGANESYDNTTDGAQTALAANGTSDGDRAVLIIVHVDEEFADGDGGQATFTIGQTGTADKFAAAAAFTAAPAGTTFVFAGTLTEEAALLVTGGPATGTGTGGITVSVLAVPVEA